MIKNHFLYVIFFVGLLLVTNWISVSADIVSGPNDYTVNVGNDGYIFVMLSIEGDGYLWSSQNPVIRNQYSQTGLYHLENIEEPLWTVDWYAYSVTVSDDGRHLIRWGGPKKRGYFGARAVAFYEEGTLLKSYAVNELVRNPFTLPRSISHYSWLANDRFDNKEKTLMIETKNGETYLFDIKTGQILEQSHMHFGPFDRYLWLCGLMIVAVSTIGIRLMRGRNGSSRR